MADTALRIIGVDFSKGSEVILDLSDETTMVFTLEQLLKIKPIQVITAEDAEQERKASEA